MLKINFDPDQLEPEDRKWWDAWLKRATDATARHIAAWEAWYVSKTRPGDAAAGINPGGGLKKPPTRPNFNDAIWTEFKNQLLVKIFGNKCSYCETANPIRWPVEVEHYRPKGDVGYRSGDGAIAKARTKDAADQDIDHPGYFWLAYNWKNLLPCCKRCNSGKGKNTQFPTGKGYIFLRKLKAGDDALTRASASTIWKGWYYAAPEDLDPVEDPLLINPYLEDPADHITFGIKGIAASKTPKGEYSIATFDLADQDLREQRQRAQEMGLLSYMFLLQSFRAIGDSLDIAREKALKKMEQDRRNLEYSAAVFDALPVLWKQLAPTD